MYSRGGIHNNKLIIPEESIHSNTRAFKGKVFINIHQSTRVCKSSVCIKMQRRSSKTHPHKYKGFKLVTSVQMQFTWAQMHGIDSNLFAFFLKWIVSSSRFHTNTKWMESTPIQRRLDWLYLFEHRSVKANTIHIHASM